MSAYRSSWISAAPIDDYFSNLPAITTHDFIDSDTLSHHMTGEDRGTPTVGIYANDGLWDEEDSEISTTRFSSSAATSSIKTKGGSMKSRSNRSGTASPFPPEEEKSGMWGWVQRGRDSPQSTDVKPLSKKESKAKLRGMGRRGELMVVVDPEGCVSGPHLTSTNTSSPHLLYPQHPLHIFKPLSLLRPPSSPLLAMLPSTTRTTPHPSLKDLGRKGSSGSSAQSPQRHSERSPIHQTHLLSRLSPRHCPSTP